MQVLLPFPVSPYYPSQRWASPVKADKDQADRAKRSRPKNYQCDKCGTAIQSGQQPAYVKCRSGGYHNWQNLGLVGSINYECGKCGVTVKSAEAPAFVRCPTGAYHDWNRL